VNRTPTVGSALSVAVEGGEIESIEYLANGSSLRATVYGRLGRKVQVEVNGFRDAGNNEMQEMQFTVQIKLDGTAEAPLVTIEKDDRVLIIKTTVGTLQASPSVNDPWKNIETPLHLNLNDLRSAEFYRAVNP
tara:strand:- start:1007 stop:1405 length:399 start_codon:yes stop_codon:yes gene_type:complete